MALLPQRLLIQLLYLATIVLSCPDQDERCQVCIDKICVFCVYSYPDSKGRCQVPEVEIEGCYSYLPDGSCQRCSYGYYKSMEGLCYQLSPRNNVQCMLSLYSNTFCTHCKNRLLAKLGKCADSRPCSDPNCAVCFMWDQTEACDTCSDGYFLLGDDYKNGKCTLASPENKGCYYSNSEQYCMDCFGGYYFSNNRCLPTPLTVMPSYSKTYRLECIPILSILILLMIKLD